VPHRALAFTLGAKNKLLGLGGSELPGKCPKVQQQINAKVPINMLTTIGKTARKHIITPSRATVENFLNCFHHFMWLPKESPE
jgi:hypothetical protein